MGLAETTEFMRERIGDKSALATIIKFDFGDDGIIRIDGNSEPPVIDNEDSEANCTIVITLENFGAVLDGSLNAQMAFMTGKLRVEGDMGIAMQLSQVLG